ncbi:RNASEH1.2 family protein [Megaselia abdita]
MGIYFKKGMQFETVNGRTVVYTDGACINNGRQNPSAGFGVYWGPGHRLNAAEPVNGKATNNVGEIQGAIYAIETAIQYRIERLLIRTDSAFLLNAATKWIYRWCNNGWRTYNGNIVRNVEDFQNLLELLYCVDVEFEKVKGHNGIGGNIESDRLANEGSYKYNNGRACYIGFSGFAVAC